MFNFEMNNNNFQAIVIDLLIDILASNQDIKNKIDSIYPEISLKEEKTENRVLVLEYLQSKYGEIPKDLSDFLKTKGIDKSDNV